MKGEKRSVCRKNTGTVYSKIVYSIKNSMYREVET